MSDQIIPTLTPQVGDATQMLLSRIAQSLASSTQAQTPIAWLPSANYSASQSISLTVPNGAKGIVFRLIQTVVPGVDTVNLMLGDVTTGRGMHLTLASAVLQNHLLIVKTGSVFSAPASSSGSTPGLPDRVYLSVVHSGAGTFTYRTEYCWLF